VFAPKQELQRHFRYFATPRKQYMVRQLSSGKKTGGLAATGASPNAHAPLARLIRVGRQRKAGKGKGLTNLRTGSKTYNTSKNR